MGPFKFKQFAVHQDRCAMKIGTDGVLLGAWASVDHHPQSILDIGSGTGLIALQLAQRSAAELVDAIELDGNAYEQCVENFEASPWSDRLFCYHAGLDEFVEEMDAEYDLIVSNPPFYSEEMPSGSTARDMARQESSLPFHELVAGVSKLLSQKGLFSVVVPYKAEEEFKGLAKEVGLFPKRLLRVKGTAAGPVKRSLLEFSFQESDPEENTLTIERERHQYTQEYIQLTQPFYLKM
nr:methyltransferase [Allomuricauda sp.]